MDFNSNEKQCNNNAINYDSPVTENKLRTDPNHNFSNYIHMARAASSGVRFAEDVVPALVTAQARGDSLVSSYATLHTVSEWEGVGGGR
jgi:hypothetical protein